MGIPLWERVILGVNSGIEGHRLPVLQLRLKDDTARELTDDTVQVLIVGIDHVSFCDLPLFID